MTTAAATTTSAPEGAAKAYHYSPQELDTCKAIQKWLDDHDHSRSWLATKLRKSSGTVSQVLNGKYVSPPGELLTAMLAILQLESERLDDGTPGYVEGSVHKLAFVVCDRTRKHANFGVLAGNVGVGKTRTLREYQRRKPQTLMIESNPMMTAGSLLIELLEQLKVLVPAGLDRKFQAIVKQLQGTGYLLIVDEAENLSGQALHYLRRIRDKAGVGIVLSGTSKLHQLLKPEQGQFDQIRSRVSMWPQTIGGISRDDADEMARAGLADAPLPEGAEIGDDVLDALWAYCGGSARVLMESLIPAIRDYGYGKQPMTGKLVDSIASKVLFMNRATVRGAA